MLRVGLNYLHDKTIFAKAKYMGQNVRLPKPATYNWEDQKDFEAYLKKKSFKVEA